MKKKEPVVELTKEQKKVAVRKIRDYLHENFEIESGNLQAEIFLDYLTDSIGAFYYNKAVADSLGLMTDKVEELYLLMKDEEE